MSESKTDSRTFTEAEHEAILTEAVRREIASATEALETENAELKNRVDVLEAEKAEALTAKETAQNELEEFKAEIARTAEVEARKESRIAAVKEIAATELPETYFSDERVTRWAEMADENFEALLDDMAEQAMAHLDDREVAEVSGIEEGEARRKKIAEVLASKKEQAAAHGADRKVTTETAAFTGGKTPSDPASGGSNFHKWLGARRGAPAAN